MSAAGSLDRPGDAPLSIPELLARFPDGSPPVGTAGAAVTIVLREGLHETEVLLIERAVSPTDPASGQVGLPGGHVEESDSSMAATALRELREEVGLQRSDLQGAFRYVETRTAARFRLKVSTFAAELGPNASPPSAASPAEVAHIFWMPRSALSVERRVPRDTAMGWIEVPATLYEGHVIWGFTRRLLRDFFGFPDEEELGGLPFAPHAQPTA
jgi:8-oxo-dGTP diphosphatase